MAELAEAIAADPELQIVIKGWKLRSPSKKREDCCEETTQTSAEPFNEQKTSLVHFSSESSPTTECSPESSATLSRAPSGSSETPLLVPAENSETSVRMTGEGCDTSGGLPSEHNGSSCRREEMTPATLSAQPQSPDEQAVRGPSSPMVRRPTRKKRQPCRLNYDEQF
ncbi:hypothetical protein MRX96_002890 [Rhipicephalus microplus]